MFTEQQKLQVLQTIQLGSEKAEERSKEHRRRWKQEHSFTEPPKPLDEV